MKFLLATLAVLLVGVAALSSIPLVDAAEVDTSIDAAAVEQEPALQQDPLPDRELKTPMDQQCFDYTGSPTPCPEEEEEEEVQPDLVAICIDSKLLMVDPAEVGPFTERPGDAILGSVENGISLDANCVAVVNGFCYYSGQAWVPTINTPLEVTSDAGGTRQPGDTVEGGILGPDCALIPEAPLLGSISGEVQCESFPVVEVSLMQGGVVIASASALSNNNGSIMFVDLPLGTYTVVADVCDIGDRQFTIAADDLTHSFEARIPFSGGDEVE